MQKNNPPVLNLGKVEYKYHVLKGLYVYNGKIVHRSLSTSAIAICNSKCPSRIHYLDCGIFELWKHTLEANSLHKFDVLHLACTEDVIGLTGCKNANLSHCNEHKSVLVHQNYRRQMSRIFNYLLSYS